MTPSDILRAETPKVLSEFQRDWRQVVLPLRRGRYWVEDLESRSIHGDAPKNFIKIKEYVEGKLSHKRRNWTGYIAKVAYKHYPNESITEQLLTRIGQVAGVIVADSMLSTTVALRSRRVAAALVMMPSRRGLVPPPPGRPIAPEPRLQEDRPDESGQQPADLGQRQRDRRGEPPLLGGTSAVSAARMASRKAWASKASVTCRCQPSQERTS